MSNPVGEPSLKRFAWLSIACALITIALKTGAYFITGSVGLLSDALESGVNLVAAIFALVALGIAELPEDDEHAFGHSKAEYFSSGVEGVLIIAAAILIVVSSIPRLRHPEPLDSAGWGLVVSIGASVINLIVARVLIRTGKRRKSIALEADGKHLMTDVWTSAGVIVAIALVALTGWQRLDPIVALLVAANIVWSGVMLMKRSVNGLMDSSLPPEEMERVKATLAKFTGAGIQYHALRSRVSGGRSFISFHVLVPGHWTVQRGHALLERIEAQLREELPAATVFTHLESLNDPASWNDQQLDRGAS